MPNPTVSDVHVNRPLTNLSTKFLQDQNYFVADKVFPSVPVLKQSDLYYTFNRDDFFRDDARLRAPGTETAGGGYRLSTDNYFCKIYGFHKDISDPERENTDAPLNSDRDATQFVSHKMLIAKEAIWASTYFTGGVWTYDYDGVASGVGTNEVYQWSDYTNSDPIKNVDDASGTILETTGYEPNTLVLGYHVFKALKNHPDIIDRVKYVQNIGPNETVKVSASALASLFFDGVPGARVVVAKAIKNTSNEGANAVQSQNSFINGKKALLCYSAPSPGIDQVSAGYTFTWTGFTGAGPAGCRIKKFRMENIASDRIEAEMAFDFKKVSADLGFFWDTIVA